jgi:tRNA 2-thiouridine synthesizing protein A
VSAELAGHLDTLAEPDVIGLTDETWDAGELACGDLILMLRRRMNDLPPGTILKLTAQDSGATEDIPAWCRMTGHKLLAQQHPHYWIQRKE